MRGLVLVRLGTVSGVGRGGERVVGGEGGRWVVWAF